ncbi:MAG: HEAT repeat domain-containing protein [Candidatus Hydrogenedentes bacterium]|nr:HEAT repeat domain-containing protein [Candidatus Hydrogenedentota bacterium]
MNQTMRISRAVLSALLVLAAGVAYAQDLDQGLEALKSYKFGDSRTALAPVEAAALSAKTDNALRGKLEASFIALLKSDAAIDAKRFVCRQLAVMGTRDSVDTLASLIADPGLADYALRALVENPNPAALDALVAAIDSAPATQKVAVINALARKGDERAVKPLTALLDHADQALAQAATAALGGIGGSGCAPLFDRLEARGTAGGAVLADACLQCASSLDAKGREQAIGVYNALYEPSQPGHIRAAALSGLVALQPEKARDYVVAALNESDPNLVLVASGFIRNLPGEEATATFAGMLAGADPKTQLLLIDALAHRGEPGALDAIMAAANGENETVRLAALAALGRLGTHETVPFLLELAANASGEAQRTARASIATIPGNQADVAALKAAQEGAGAVQLEAIRALASRRAIRTSPALLDLAATGEANVRAEALSALRVLAGQDDMAALLGILADAGDDTQRRNAAQTITDLAGRIPADDGKTAPVVNALAGAPNDPTRAALIGILGRIATDEALAVVREQVQAATGPVQVAAVEALAAWPDTRTLPDLKALAGNAAHPARGAAFAGYVRQLRAAGGMTPGEKLAAFREADGMAQGEQEKKLVVAGLAEVPSLEALQYVEARQQDPAVAAEATQAVLRIAASISGAHRDEVARRMSTYLQQDTSDAVKKQAQNVLDGLAAFEDYITAWQYAGPYFEEGKPSMSFFDTPFAPETDPASVNWSIAPMGLDRAQPWKVHLAQFIGGAERVAYLRTTLTAQASRDVILEVGTNDGCKVWWNGKLIESLNVGRAFSPGQDQLPVALKEGENTLMIAVYQHGGDWAAAARLRTHDGQPVAGVTQSAK